MVWLDNQKAILVFLVGLVINTFGMLYTQHHGLRHYVRNQCKRPRDVGFLSLPRGVIPEEAVNWPLVVPVIASLLSSKRGLIFRDFAFLFGAVLMIRGIAISVTQLPESRDIGKQRSVWQICTTGGDFDKVVSGHTSWMLLFTLVLIKYGVWNRFSLVLPVAVAILLVQTRAHYTVDVWLGGVISTLLFLAFGI